eukprot:gnl/TRDRNA2_/TRDRNA2_188351_c0_seq1.p1 gnl/TRDRNA2_/TRDRNA2_188351_c0~~gnl/TRDRNA2_/TRDRNA2_188351_c0_seq1.p1  ORF type:complete len:274 (+),score=66.45 gnl/TRDRNA2_/TRDRNA2_188351_c0_seq1:36-824(+)
MDVATMGMNLAVGDGGPEERRFDTAAQDVIVRTLKSVKLLIPTGERVTLDEVNINGEAQIHFRKGQRYPFFDYKITMPMRVRLNSGELVTGTFEIPEFTNAYGPVPDDFEVQVPVVRDWHCAESTAKVFKKMLQKELSPTLREALLDISEEVVRLGMAPPEPQQRRPPDLQAMLAKAEADKFRVADGFVPVQGMPTGLTKAILQHNPAVGGYQTAPAKGKGNSKGVDWEKAQARVLAARMAKGRGKGTTEDSADRGCGVQQQ